MSKWVHADEYYGWLYVSDSFPRHPEHSKPVPDALAARLKAAVAELDAVNIEIDGINYSLD